MRGIQTYKGFVELGKEHDPQSGYDRTISEIARIAGNTKEQDMSKVPSDFYKCLDFSKDWRTAVVNRRADSFDVKTLCGDLLATVPRSEDYVAVGGKYTIPSPNATYLIGGIAWMEKDDFRLLNNVLAANEFRGGPTPIKLKAPVNKYACCIRVVDDKAIVARTADTPLHIRSVDGKSSAILG